MLRSIVLLAAVSASAYDGGLPSKTPKGLSGSAWSSIRAEYQRHRQAMFSEDGGHRARNYGQRWLTRFDGRGFEITPDAGVWRWGLQLQSYGFAGDERAVKSARANADVEKLSYQWDSRMTEWFVNGNLGLEHGFTLASRPGEGVSSLVLHFTVRGTLTPIISGDGRRISFLDHRGAPAINYAGLKVTDAQGRELTARFARESSGLRLEVQEQNARYPIMIDPIAQQAYLKPAGAGATQAVDWFGYSVAVSGDTVVVGAPQEDSSTLGINSTPNELASAAGAAYVFAQNGGVWSQQAYLKPAFAGPGGQSGDHFGWSVAISGDTVVVGAPEEDSNTTGVNSTPAEGAGNSGAAYVFIRSGGVWSQQAYLKPPKVGVTVASTGYEFGYSVAISGDTLAVGAYNEASSSTGVNSSSNDLAPGAGAAYVFARSGTTWTQQAYLKPAAVGTTQANDHFGAAIAVGGDTVVVGAFQEDSSSTGINSTPNESSGGGAGAAYVYVRSGGVWSQQAYLKPAVVGLAGQAGHFFGTSVAISGDTIVVGANHEASSTLGVNTTPNDGAASSGAVYVFTRSAGAWTQQAYLKPLAVGSTQAGDNFGYSVAIFEDMLVVGAPGEGSSSTGINSTPNELAAIAGATYVFTRSFGVWSQQAYLKPAAVGLTQAGDNFGVSVGVGADFIVVGASLEDSSTTAVNSTPNEGAADSGAAYVFSIPFGGLGGDSKAVITNPAPGSTLSGPNVTFTWTPGSGAVDYWLEVGTVVGGSNLFQGGTAGTSLSVTGLPTDGSTLYVRLWTNLSAGPQYNDYTYKAIGGSSKAVMISPAPGTTLTGASITFTWSVGQGASAYLLDVGTAQNPASIYSQNLGLATAQTVNGIPTDGSTVYVKLWTNAGGVWSSNDYTYKAAGGNTKAVMLLPAPGSVLAGARVAFTWSTGSGALAYWLEVASSQGTANIYGQNAALATTKNVSGIPTDGRTIYVRLWTNFASGWQYNDYTYTAGGSSKAVLISPVPNSGWSSANVSFTWSAAAGAVNYWLSIGTTAGGFNLFNSFEGLTTSQAVTGLPTNGSTVFVRLWTGFATGYQFNDYTYRASGGLTAVITSPTPSSMLTGSTVTFTWSAASGATDYWLEVGTTLGGIDLYSQSLGLATSQTVTGLPRGGGTIYVRLFALINGGWKQADYTYRAAP